MSRPKPTVLLEFVNKKTYRSEQVLDAEAIWAVFYKNKPFNLKSSNMLTNYPGPKYKKTSFSNPGHAHNLAKKLNDMFESADDQDEMTVRLAEIIKAKSSEYHQCESRIENLTKKLQGDRGARLANKQKETESFLSIVQLFQEEEERKNMVRIAEMQKELIKEEAQKIEGMAAWKARVLGISIEDTL